MSLDVNCYQRPINGTVQHMVLPGNQTELYYILISNLQWGTSWQQVKDYVRTVSTVERVEVFKDSTCGWVSVRGRHNFDAALALLNGGVLDGRAIVADGKNATEPIMIKELVDTSHRASPRSPQTPRYAASPATHYPASLSPLMSPATSGYNSEWTTAAPSSASAMTLPPMVYATYPMPMTTMPYDYSQAPVYYPAILPNGSYADHSSVTSSGTSQYGYEAGYEQQYSTVESNGMVQTKRRKIIIKHLQPWATYSQVNDLVQQQAGSDVDKIQQIDLPLAEGRETNRGYALVTFKTEDAANKIIRRLHDVRYEGKMLKVTHTMEGVSEVESSRSHSSGNHRHHHHSARGSRDMKDKKDRKENSKSLNSSSNDKKTRSHKSDVIIANGSTISPPRGYDEKGRKSSKRY